MRRSVSAGLQPGDNFTGRALTQSMEAI